MKVLIKRNIVIVEYKGHRREVYIKQSGKAKAAYYGQIIKSLLIDIVIDANLSYNKEEVDEITREIAQCAINTGIKKGWLYE